MIKISVPARLHLTLIDLGAKGYRRNGGIGFSIDEPRLVLKFVKSSGIDLKLLRAVGFLDSDLSGLQEAVEAVREKHSAGGLTLIDVMAPPRHSGFGTGTATALACIEAYSLLYGCCLTEQEITFHSKRGGTSGIGVNSYFEGGFIFDVGRRYDSSRLISSDRIDQPKYLPHKLIRLPMPDWPVGVLIPSGVPSPTLEQEDDLFKRALPVAEEEVHRVTYHAVFGACAAIAEADFNSFCVSINEIQGCAWKKAEISEYGEHIHSLMTTLKILGADAVGMSSVGPSVFFLASSFDSVFKRVRKHFEFCQVTAIQPNNYGRIVEYD